LLQNPREIIKTLDEVAWINRIRTLSMASRRFFAFAMISKKKIHKILEKGKGKNPLKFISALMNFPSRYPQSKEKKNLQHP
jgi:hypothetical protein